MAASAHTKMAPAERALSCGSRAAVTGTSALVWWLQGSGRAPRRLPSHRGGCSEGPRLHCGGTPALRSLLGPCEGGHPQPAVPPLPAAGPGLRLVPTVTEGG